MSLAKGIYGIEYDPGRRDEHPLGPFGWLVILVLLAAAVSLVVTLCRRKSPQADETETEAPTEIVQEVVEPRPQEQTPPPPPVVTGVQQGALDPNVVWFSGGKLTISGENLAGTTQVRFEMDDEGETIVNDITDSIEEITDTALSTDEYGFENDSERQDLDWSGKNAKLIVVKGEESVEYAVTFKVAE